jgi:hypothetical protein
VETSHVQDCQDCRRGAAKILPEFLARQMAMDLCLAGTIAAIALLHRVVLIAASTPEL